MRPDTVTGRHHRNEHEREVFATGISRWEVWDSGETEEVFERKRRVFTSRYVILCFAARPTPCADCASLAAILQLCSAPIVADNLVKSTRGTRVKYSDRDRDYKGITRVEVGIVCSFCVRNFRGRNTHRSSVNVAKAKDRCDWKVTRQVLRSPDGRYIVVEGQLLIDTLRK